MTEDYSFREIVSQMFNICFRVITFIFAISSIAMSCFNADYTGFGSKDIWYVILIGVISGLLFIIYYIPKKVSKKLMLGLQAIYFASINVTVMVIGAKLHWYNPEQKLSIAVMEGIFVLVYFIVLVLTYIIDYKKASRMNYLLQKRKEKKLEESKKETKE